MSRPLPALLCALSAALATALAAVLAGGCPGPPPAPSQIETPSAPGAAEAPAPPAPEATAPGTPAPEVPADADAAAEPVQVEPADAPTPADEPDPGDDAADAEVGDERDLAAGPARSAGHDREVLAQAYVALYCAQRRGETTRLGAIYAAHGFDDPAAWRLVWERASEDRAWLAEVTQRAIVACP